MYKYKLKEFWGHLKNSFSLGELIIALGVIGILAMILMPMLNKAKPDENEVLHKKATFIVERVVNEISTDEFLYPTGSEYSGLSNTSAVTVNGEIHSGSTKFCTLFASRINRASGTSVDCRPNKKSVTSAEGIDWYLPVSNFKDNDFEIIKVDVNGAKGPNCMGKSSKCYHPDQFVYKINKGIKVTVKHVGNLEATAPPAARPGMPDEPNGDTTDPRTAQKWYCIRCNAPANGKVYGFGCNKPNGHYQLVAIPNIGYKGSWFTKSVTVNNADVPESECNVTFTPIVDIPKPDGGTVTPPPTPPAPTEPEKTYCINVTKIGGDTTQCAVAGDGCGKKPGTYVVSASGKGDYKTNWTTKDVTIVDKNISLTLSCDKEPEPEKCYSITTTGDTTNCPVSLPAGTCPTDTNKYTSGTYSYTVTPKAGFTYNKVGTASTKQIIVNDKDETIAVECLAASAKKTYPLTITDHDRSTAYADGTLLVWDSNAYKGTFTKSDGSKVSFSNRADVEEGATVNIYVKSKAYRGNSDGKEDVTVYGLFHNSTLMPGGSPYSFLIDTYKDNANFVVEWASDQDYITDPPADDIKYTITLRSEMTLGAGLYNFPEMYCIGSSSDLVTLSGAGTYEAGVSHEISTNYHGSCYFDDSKYRVTFVGWKEGGSTISTSKTTRITVDKNKILTAVWEVSSINAFPEKQKYQIITNTDGNGTWISGAGTYEEGATCLLTAKSAGFDGWYDRTDGGNVLVSSSPNYRFRVTKMRLLFAKYNL